MSRQFTVGAGEHPTDFVPVQCRVDWDRRVR